MNILIFVLNWIYLLAISILAIMISVLYVRSSRTQVYYPLSLSGLSLLLLMLMRVLEVNSFSRPFLPAIISLGFMLLAVIAVLSVQTIYIIISRSRFPLIFQLFSGAAALLVFFFLLRYVEPIQQQYQDMSFSSEFIIYLLLPYLTFLVFVLLFIFLAGKNHINLTVFSFDKVMLAIPDKIFVLDRDGYIVDQNHRGDIFSHCRDTADLISLIGRCSGAGGEKLARVLTDLDQQGRDEIEWQLDSLESRIWNWSFQPVKSTRGKNAGYILIISDMTASRGISQQLQIKNDELSRINQKLSGFSEQFDKYSSAAARKEIADIIDKSVRQKLDHSTLILRDLSYVEDEVPRDKILTVIGYCRQSLEDIRSLVSRLTR